MKEIIYGLLIAACIGASILTIYFGDKRFTDRAHQCKAHGGALLRTGSGYECLKVERVAP